MDNLKTDSPTSRRIVRAFLDFLNHVEPAPGVDLEGLEVARECLELVFKLDSFTNDDQIEPHSLVDIYSSAGMRNLPESKVNLPHESISSDAASSFISQNSSDANLPKEANSLAEDSTSKAHAFGASKDELFGQFFAALEKIQFFRVMPNGSDDAVGVEKATQLFHNAIAEMDQSGCQEYNIRNLAETLKSQGNRAMQSKLFFDAIEFYNCAIALFENNAVYYCNRAAAYTLLNKYNEAIRDCLKSIEIDSTYSKAYSRLGTAYFAQGNYSDALNKGFKRALQLDPSNEVVKENIRMAEQKLREDQQRSERDRSASSSSQTDSEHHNQFTGGSRSHNAPPPFGSIPFNMSGLPADLANMFMNMATNAYQGQHSQNTQGDNGNETSRSDEPGIQFGGNINLNFGDQMPEDLTGALRSVMEMFSGAAPQGNSQDTSPGRSAPPS